MAHRGDRRLCSCRCKMLVSQQLFLFALVGFFDEAAPQVVFWMEAFADGFENWRRVGRGFSCLFLFPSLPCWEQESILRVKKEEMEFGYQFALDIFFFT